MKETKINSIKNKEWTIDFPQNLIKHFHYETNYDSYCRLGSYKWYCEYCGEDAPDHINTIANLTDVTSNQRKWLKKLNSLKDLYNVATS